MHIFKKKSIPFKTCKITVAYIQAETKTKFNTQFTIV